MNILRLIKHKPETARFEVYRKYLRYCSKCGKPIALDWYQRNGFDVEFGVPLFKARYSCTQKRKWYDGHSSYTFKRIKARDEPKIHGDNL